MTNEILVQLDNTLSWAVDEEEYFQLTSSSDVTQSTGSISIVFQKGRLGIRVSEEDSEEVTFIFALD